MLEKKEKVLEKKAAAELERAKEFSKAKNKRGMIKYNIAIRNLYLYFGGTIGDYMFLLSIRIYWVQMLHSKLIHHICVFVNINCFGAWCIGSRHMHTFFGSYCPRHY